MLEVTEKPLTNKQLMICCIVNFVISLIAIVLSIVAIVEVKTQEPKVVEKPVYISETTTEVVTTEAPTTEAVTEESTTKPVETTKKVEPTTVRTTTQSKPASKNTSLTEDEIRLIARMTMAEAEGESEYGKRLVIDTILNRVDSSEFPNTVNGVIYQKGQFSPVTNGRLDRCYVRDDIYNLVLEELESRTNSEVLFFNMGGYPSWATPVLKEGCHYFSK
jgi:N-acetylmuramoyl-L-alanine amidase